MVEIKKKIENKKFGWGVGEEADKALSVLTYY